MEKVINKDQKKDIAKAISNLNFVLWWENQGQKLPSLNGNNDYIFDSFIDELAFMTSAKSWFAAQAVYSK